MTTPYIAIIGGQAQEVCGWDDAGNLLVKDGCFAFKSLGVLNSDDSLSAPDFDFRGKRLLEVALLNPRTSEWFLNGEEISLENWRRLELKRLLDKRGIPMHQRTAPAQMKALFRSKAGELHHYMTREILFHELSHLNNQAMEQLCAVAWFGHDDGADGWNTPIFLNTFRRIVVGKPEEAMAKRMEAFSKQFYASAKHVQEVLSPLTRLYSDGEFAEIRKRAIGKGVPDLFVDWTLCEFQKSQPPRLPTKGDAFNNCGPGTLIGRKLESNFGISKQRLADHLTVIRGLLVEKGWLAAASGLGKSRKRNSYMHPDDQFEDINQPSPSESAEDSDDNRRAAALEDRQKDGEKSEDYPQNPSDAD